VLIECIDTQELGHFFAEIPLSNLSTIFFGKFSNFGNKLGRFVTSNILSVFFDFSKWPSLFPKVENFPKKLLIKSAPVVQFFASV